MVLQTLSSFGQTPENVKISGDFLGIAYLYQGIPFLSLEIHDRESYMLYKQTERYYCNQVRKSFSVNGLSLSEQDYLKLVLHKNEVDLNNCYYTEDYCGDSISQINFFARVKIPIVVNGIEYLYEDTIPIKDLQGKRLNFKKQERFLRKNRIIIESE